MKTGIASIDAAHRPSLVCFVAALVVVVLVVHLSNHPSQQQHPNSAMNSVVESISGEARLNQPRRSAATEDRGLSNNSHRMQEFPSLQLPLRNSALVGLYFAAAWCPMSTPVTQLLDDVLRDRLQDPVRNDFTLVYVSSDRTAQAFHEYLRPGWKTIPFERIDERSDLKRRFRTCAKPEMAGLGLATRDAEIPHLVVLTARGDVLQSSKGIVDVKDHKKGVIEYWLSLLERQQKATASAVVAE